ncbi:MAG: hypothetical protein R2709_03775 [Marmoricola sp.]
MPPSNLDLPASSGCLSYDGPAPRSATVAGGGFIASGPAGKGIGGHSPGPRQALQLTALEGAGEVQTPLSGLTAGGLKIGELVWFRHAKSGKSPNTPTPFICFKTPRS